MILSKIYAVLVLVCMSVSVAANELATGDDVLLSDTESSAVFLEAEFSVTEWGDMQVTLHTDDVNAAQVHAMADYFASFTDFVEIIDIHAPQSEDDQQNLSIHGVLPALILRSAQDQGDSPVGAQHVRVQVISKLFS
ncbi:MAG: hypothetical protein AAGB12_14880 [Pseudomonadota bacterium]